MKMTLIVSVYTLSQGDIIEAGGDKENYTVLDKYGNHVVAVREVLVTNPSEWVCDNRRLENISDLNVGNKIVNDLSKTTYVVTSTHGESVIAMKSIYLKTSSECNLKAKSTHVIM
jgi:hypothetical protein